MQGPVLLGLNRHNQEFHWRCMVQITMLQSLPKVDQAITSYECTHLTAPKVSAGVIHLAAPEE